MEIEIVRAGLFTTVQDQGRPGWRAAGVPPGGAADAAALRTANRAVGNDIHAAGLECTLVGPQVRFSTEALIAVSGAVAGDLPADRAIPVPAGQVLSLERIAGGCRAYLAVAGGVDVPLLLGSRSTDVRCGWGGYRGRALRAGDTLPIGAPPPIPPPRFAQTPTAPLTGARVLRVLRSSAWDDCKSPPLGVEYTVSSQSDRMGVRLAGPPLRMRRALRARSAAVLPGAIQSPPDGQPIVLSVDAPTIGGYPVVAYVIAADLSRLAQLRPGDRVAFEETTLIDARRLGGAGILPAPDNV